MLLLMEYRVYWYIQRNAIYSIFKQFLTKMNIINQTLSIKKLVEALNQTFPNGKAQTKTLFTTNDIIHYIRRGNIPQKYGGNILLKEKVGSSIKISVGNRKF